MGLGLGGRRWAVRITAFRSVEGKVRGFENDEKLSWFVFRRFWVNARLGLVMGTAGCSCEYLQQNFRVNSLGAN